MFDHFSFEYPWMFTLLLPLIGALIWHAFKPVPTLQIPWKSAFHPTSKRHPVARLYKIIPFIFEAVAGILLVVALAGPRTNEGEITQKSRGVDILIAIDLSGSMEAFDAPKNILDDNRVATLIRNGNLPNRLKACKEAVQKFIEARPNDRIGIIAFAAAAYAVCPPTADHAWLKLQLDKLSLHTVGEGTGIAAPIAAAVERLKSADAERKVMVLFSDGQNTVANAMTPIQAAELAQTHNITIHTVGIGSKRAFVVVDRGFFGRSIERYTEQFDVELMKSIAKKTNGVYLVADDPEGMTLALNDIDKLETKTQEMPIIVIYDSTVNLFAGLALLAILIAFILRRTVFLRFP